MNGATTPRRGARYALLGRHTEATVAALRQAADAEVLAVDGASQLVRVAERLRPDVVVVASTHPELDAAVGELCDAGMSVVVVDETHLGASRLLELGRLGAHAIWDGRAESLAAAEAEACGDAGSPSGVHRAQGRFVRLLRSIPAAVWSLDLRACHQILSGRLDADFSAALQACVHEARSQPLNELAATYRDIGAVAAALLQAWFSGDRVPRLEVDVPRDGQNRALLVSAAMPPTGELGQVLVVGLDVTEHRQLTRALVASQRLEAVGTLAAGLAHDFRNILTILRSYTDLVGDEIPEGSPAHADLDVMRDATDRATALIAQLLAFSRKQPQTVVPLDLNEVVSGIQKLVARSLGEDIELRLDLAPTPLPISADRSQLDQVLLNLAVNARDAMPRGGRLWFRTTLRRAAESWTHSAGFRIPAGRYACVEVSDEGTGMSPETLDRIFEPFFSTKLDRGSGLGLATAYGIVKQHGGFITATSKVGVGTTFEVLLPLRTGDEPTRSAGGSFFRESQPSVARRVLLVEDDPDVRKALARLLELRGHSVRETGDPDEALAWIDDESVRFDVLMSDVVMPKISGLAIAARVRRSRPEVGIVLMSGRDDHDALVRSVPENEAVFLRKPATGSSVLAALDDALARARTRRA